MVKGSNRIAFLHEMKNFIMILIASMWAQIPSGPDNFERVIKYQTSFYGGFESAANISE